MNQLTTFLFLLGIIAYIPGSLSGMSREGGLVIEQVLPIHLTRVHPGNQHRLALPPLNQGPRASNARPNLPPAEESYSSWVARLLYKLIHNSPEEQATTTDLPQEPEEEAPLQFILRENSISEVLLRHLDRESLKNLTLTSKQLRDILASNLNKSLSVSLAQLSLKKFSPLVGKVKTLILRMPGNSKLTRDHINFINDQFSSVTSLVLRRGDNSQWDAEVDFDLLAASSLASRLEQLEFDRIYVINITKNNLDKCKELASLKLKSTLIDARLMNSLITSSLAERLEELHIEGGKKVVPLFFKEILKKFPTLKRLTLQGAIGDAEFSALAESDLARKLRMLDLSFNTITEASFTKKNLKKFTQLKELVLSKEFIAAINTLMQSGLVAKLERLTFNAYCLNDTDFELLMATELVGRIHELNLQNNKISASKLTKGCLNKFTNLQVLNLSDSALDDSLIIALVQSSLANQLVELDVTNTKINESTLRKNISLFPKLKVLNGKILS